MTDDDALDELPSPEELVGKDELDEDDEMTLDGAALVEDADDVDTERAVPVLSVHDLDLAERFYARLGFTVRSRHEGYLILWRNGAELHLSLYAAHDPFATDGMAYLRLGDVRAQFDALRAAGDLLLAPASGVTAEMGEQLRRRFEDTGSAARLHEIEDKPWGMREFAVIDPSGNLLRVGEPITR